jgi:hypothetical protein
METTDHTTAEQVALKHAEIIRRIEDLTERYPNCPDAVKLLEMVKDSTDELGEHPEYFTMTERHEQRLYIDQMCDDAMWIQDHLPTHNEGERYTISYVDKALEIIFRGHFDMYHAHRWQCDEIQLLITYRNPTVQVIAAVNNVHVTITGKIKNDTAQITTYAPHLARHLEEMTEDV